MSERFTDKDFDDLIRLRIARTVFVEKIYDHAVIHRQSVGLPPLATKELRALRLKHEPISAICELFAILDVPRAARSERIAEVLARHNDYIDFLLQNAEDRGDDFPGDRLENSKFSDAQVARLQRMDVKERIELDQSALARLLSPLMSFESTRSLIELLEMAGLLTRENVVHVMVGSPGHLEKYYLEYLREVSSPTVRSEEGAE
jgi:hypothetical protein